MNQIKLFGLGLALCMLHILWQVEWTDISIHETVILGNLYIVMKLSSNLIGYGLRAISLKKGIKLKRLRQTVVFSGLTLSI